MVCIPEYQFTPDSRGFMRSWDSFKVWILSRLCLCSPPPSLWHLEGTPKLIKCENPNQNTDIPRSGTQAWEEALLIGRQAVEGHRSPIKRKGSLNGGGCRQHPAPSCPSPLASAGARSAPLFECPGNVAPTPSLLIQEHTPALSPGLGTLMETWSSPGF